MSLTEVPAQPTRVLVAKVVAVVTLLAAVVFGLIVWPVPQRNFAQASLMPSLFFTLAVAAIVFGSLPFVNGFDPPRHSSIRHFLTDWLSRTALSFAWLCLWMGIALLVDPGTYSRWTALLFFLPMTLFAAFSWHKHWFARRAAKFPQPTSSKS